MDSSQDIEILKLVETIKQADARLEFIVLYGSVAEGMDNKLSDIDIAVYYHGDKKERFNFRIKILGRVNKKFDVQTFQDLPLYIQKEIITKGKILYCRNYDNLFGIYFQTIKEYADFEKYLHIYYSNIGAGIIEATG